MSPRGNSTKIRRQCFEAHRYRHPLTGRTVMDCHICGGVIDPAAGDTWEAEHVLPHNVGGTAVAPAHAGKNSCHAEKTAQEASVRAQVKRGAERHFGVKRSSRPMPFGRNSPLKRKLNGQIVQRDQ